MIEMVKVTQARALDDRRLWLRFSNARSDFADIFAEGGVMVEPLRDPAMFARVFLEFGAPTWPSGFDLDPIALYREMDAAGILTPVAAE